MLLRPAATHTSRQQSLFNKKPSRSQRRLASTECNCGWKVCPVTFQYTSLLAPNQRDGTGPKVFRKDSTRWPRFIFARLEPRVSIFISKTYLELCLSPNTATLYTCFAFLCHLVWMQTRRKCRTLLSTGFIFMTLLSQYVPSPGVSVWMWRKQAN